MINFDINQSIFLSIKPKFVDLIISREKNHEFRTRIPKRDIKFIWVYTTTPVAKFEYILEVEKQIRYPEKIKNEGIGNNEFNKGEKRGKFAYPIKNIFKLKKPLNLKELKENFGFTAPQGFFYLDKHEKIINCVEKFGVEKINK